MKTKMKTAVRKRPRRVSESPRRSKFSSLPRSHKSFSLPTYIGLEQEVAGRAGGRGRVRETPEEERVRRFSLAMRAASGRLQDPRRNILCQLGVLRGFPEVSCVCSDGVSHREI